jgi:hypothetical protein
MLGHGCLVVTKKFMSSPNNVRGIVGAGGRKSLAAKAVMAGAPFVNTELRVSDKIPTAARHTNQQTIRFIAIPTSRPPHDQNLHAAISARMALCYDAHQNPSRQAR